MERLLDQVQLDASSDRKLLNGLRLFAKTRNDHLAESWTTKDYGMPAANVWKLRCKVTSSFTWNHREDLSIQYLRSQISFELQDAKKPND